MIYIDTLLTMAAAIWLLYLHSTQKTPVAYILVANSSVIFSIGTILWLVATSFAYVLFKGYIDHCEPTIASLSWIAGHGTQPIFPAPDDPRRYSFQYGPIGYLIDYIPFLVFGNSIASSKMMGVASCAASLIFSFFAFRAHCSTRNTLTLLGLTALCFLVFENESYWNRPDSFLILCGALAVFVVATVPPLYASVLLGTIVGIAINLKVHGLLYVAPSVVLLLTKRPRPLYYLMVCTFAAVVTIAPFLLRNVSLENYVFWLKEASRHGLSSAMLFENLSVLIPIVAPLVALGFRSSSGWQEAAANTKRYVLSVYAALMLVTIIACKPGAGPHHYLAMVSAIFYGCALLLGTSSETSSATRSKRYAFTDRLISAAILTLIIVATNSQGKVVQYFIDNWEARASTYQLKRIISQYPDKTIAMGYAGNETYGLTFARPLLTLKGNPVVLEAPPLMDMNKAGLRIPESTISMLHDCKIDLWVLPKEGKPFSMTNYYEPHKHLFENEFRRTFQSSYQLISSTQFYNIWGCRRNTPK